MFKTDSQWKIEQLEKQLAALQGTPRAPPMTASQQKIARLEEEIREKEKAIKATQGKPQISASQQRINELEKILSEKQRQLEGEEDKTAVPQLKDGIPRLKAMGLIGTNVSEDGGTDGRLPNEAEKKKLREMYNYENTTQTGKEAMQVIMCSGCDKNNPKKDESKSGRLAKSNVRIKKQELWPHMSVMRKYVKRTTFDQLDFETFVAGETKTILATEEEDIRKGRLRFLTLVAHWYCRSQDWAAVKSLYEAVVDSIELGEETWNSDFSHYETMVPLGRSVERKEKGADRKKTDKLEAYWCKAYNKTGCNQNSPHMAIVKVDEPEVPVIHMCAHCWQTNNKRLEHREADCPSKKEKL